MSNIKPSLLAVSAIIIFMCSMSVFGKSNKQIVGDDHGLIEYQNTLQAIAEARPLKKTHRQLSEIYLWGAGKCRDIGAHSYAIQLFEEAIDEDFSNIRAHRLFGDYLMGYRGVYEEAAKYYSIAEKLLNVENDNVIQSEQQKEDIKTRLNRSIQIFHRDGNDGLPIVESRDISVYFTPYTEFRKPSTNHFNPLTLYEQQLRIRERQTAFRITQGPIYTPLTDAQIRDRLPRRREEFEIGASLLFRSANPHYSHIPYLKFSFVNVTNDKNGSIEPIEVVDLWKNEFESYEFAFGRDYLLSAKRDMDYEFSIKQSESITSDIKSGIIQEIEEATTYSLLNSFRFRGKSNTLKLSTTFRFADIENFDSKGDSLNHQEISLRYSMFPPPQESENPSRFRGRRSTHFEVGASRAERTFRGESNPGPVSLLLGPSTTRQDHRFYATYEELGLNDGRIDISNTYIGIIRDYNSGFKNGGLESHEVKIEPSCVIIYKLYDDDFVKGLENLRFGLPMRVSFGDGGYDRFNMGARLNGTWEILRGLRIDPDITIDYTRFTEFEKDDWGFFAKFKLRY